MKCRGLSGGSLQVSFFMTCDWGKSIFLKMFSIYHMLPEDSMEPDILVSSWCGCHTVNVPQCFVTNMSMCLWHQEQKYMEHTVYTLNMILENGKRQFCYQLLCLLYLLLACSYLLIQKKKFLNYANSSLVDLRFTVSLGCITMPYLVMAHVL